MPKHRAHKDQDGPFWWRNVPGYDGKYQVSPDGEIRRVYGSGLVCELTPFKRKKRKSSVWLFVKLTRNGISKDIPLHKVIADTYLGKAPVGKVVRHKNGLFYDNRVENLEYIDREKLGKKTGGASLRMTVFKIDQAGNVIEIYKSAREAGKANYMSYQTVLDRCHGKVKNPYALSGFTFCF